MGAPRAVRRTLVPIFGATADPAGAIHPKETTMILAFAPLISVLLAAPQSPSLRTPDLDSLVASERAFARMSVERGMRDAFLAFLAEEAVVFEPLPVNGRRVWEARGPAKSRLMWEPAYAEISAAGDLGYTSGPWELHPPGDQPAFYGHFISVWRHPPAGDWKVVLDIGCGHEKPERGVGSGDLSAVPSTERGPWPARRRFPDRELMAAEKKLSSEAGAKGLGAALASVASGNVRVNREGRLPVLGLEAVRAELVADTSRATWTPREARASRSGDLGYAYGILERRPAAAGAAPDSSVFLHIWRREPDGRWRIALTVENPTK